MRVLHVIPSVAPRYGGPSHAVLCYCRALSSLGLTVTLATTNADGRGVLPVPTNEATEFEGVDTWFFERRGEAFKYSAPLARWLRRSVRKFDVVHVHAVFSHASLSAGRACRAAGVPYIVRPLGSLDPWSLTRHAWRKKVLLWSDAGTLLRNAAGIHFTTEAERELASTIIATVPARVIPLGVADEYLRAPMASSMDRKPLIVAMARLDRKKNLLALVRAFHAAAADSDGWRLTIAGSGDAAYTAELQHAAAAGAAASRIDFRPWVAGAEKLDLLCRASVFAVPSFQENFGLAALEAMACGLPVLAASGVNLAAAIQRAGAGWISGTSEHELSGVLADIMRDEIGRRRRAASARRLAAQFTWTSAAAQLDAWYATLAPRLAVMKGR